MRTIYDNGHFCSKFCSLGRPQKWYFFSHFQRKINFKWRFTPLKWHHRRNLGINYSDAVNSRFKTSNCFWEFLWEHGKPDPNFQVAKTAIFSIFWSFYEFPRVTCRKTKREFPYSGYSTKRSLVGDILAPKMAVLWNLQGKFPPTSRLLFLKKSQKPLNLWLCGDVISSHISILPKPYHCCKVQPFVNLWWKFHQIKLRFEVVAEKNVLFAYILSLLHYI